MNILTNTKKHIYFSQKQLFYTGVISLILFVILGFTVNGEVNSTDLSIANWVNQHRTAEMTYFMSSVTTIGDTSFASKIVLFILVLLALFGHRKYFTTFILGTGLVVFATKVTKIFFDRLRPGIADGDSLPTMLLHVDGASYPSGHAGIATVFFIFFTWMLVHFVKNRIAKIISISLVGIIALFICISRVYLGVHFATDVIGGILMSIGLSAISFWIIRKYIPALA